MDRQSREVYAPVKHACGHTVEWQFCKPKNEQEYRARKQELERMAKEPCNQCQESIEKGMVQG